MHRIPTDSDEECSQWLHKLYREKVSIFFVHCLRLINNKKHVFPPRSTSLICATKRVIILSHNLFLFS